MKDKWKAIAITGAYLGAGIGSRNCTNEVYILFLFLCALAATLLVCLFGNSDSNHDSKNTSE